MQELYSNVCATCSDLCSDRHSRRTPKGHATSWITDSQVWIANVRQLRPETRYQSAVGVEPLLQASRPVEGTTVSPVSIDRKSRAVSGARTMPRFPS